MSDKTKQEVIFLQKATGVMHYLTLFPVFQSIFAKSCSNLFPFYGRTKFEEDI